MLKQAAGGGLDTREASFVKRVEGFTLNVSRFMFSQPET
jgi:hypothetical protein